LPIDKIAVIWGANRQSRNFEIGYSDKRATEAHVCKTARISVIRLVHSTI
jgi:hypothetical protein